MGYPAAVEQFFCYVIEAGLGVIVCYLVALPVFSCTSLLYYYFPNSLNLVPAEILHNNTQACLNYFDLLDSFWVSRNLKLQLTFR